MIKSNLNWTAKKITSLTNKGELRFDNAIQREFVWDLNRMSLLIDSMLRDYPIPPLYTIRYEEDGKKTFDCIDGKQRSTTITRFRNGEFSLGEMQEFYLETGDTVDISGLKYEELPDELRDRFDSYAITTFLFSEIEDAEIKEMMSRLNNGKSLSGYENSRIKARDLSNISLIAKHPLFTQNFTESALRSYTNENVVVQAMMMLTEEEPCLETKAIRPFMESLEISEEQTELLNVIFDRISYAHDAIEDAKIAKRLVMKTHLVSIIPIVKRSIDEGATEDEVKAFLEYFFSGKPSTSEAYNGKCRYGVGQTANVKARVDALSQEYEGFHIELDMVG